MELPIRSRHRKSNRQHQQPANPSSNDDQPRRTDARNEPSKAKQLNQDNEGKSNKRARQPTDPSSSDETQEHIKAKGKDRQPKKKPHCETYDEEKVDSTTDLEKLLDEKPLGEFILNAGSMPLTWPALIEGSKKLQKKTFLVTDYVGSEKPFRVLSILEAELQTGQGNLVLEAQRETVWHDDFKCICFPIMKLSSSSYPDLCKHNRKLSNRLVTQPAFNKPGVQFKCSCGSGSKIVNMPIIRVEVENSAGVRYQQIFDKLETSLNLSSLGSKKWDLSVCIAYWKQPEV